MTDEIRTPSWRQFANMSEEYDRFVWNTKGVDGFCSSHAWAVSAREAFLPDATPAIYRHEAGFVAFAAYETEEWGRLWTPLEPGWLLTSPLVGEDQAALAEPFLRATRSGGQSWRAVLLAGLADFRPFLQSTARALSGDCSIFRGVESHRRVASLEGGMDGFLSRRAPKFRANLRRAARACRAAGLVWRFYDAAMTADEAEALFERAMAVETRSWKGRTGQGVDAGPMNLFYRNMLRRLGPKGQARILIAESNGRDVGYLFGGLMGGVYRGFQFSFDADYRRLGLGNMLQGEMIERLCAEGAEAYDLGVAADYKARWAERLVTTSTLLIGRR